MANPIIAREERIGQISAEADEEFLFECFFDHPSLAILEDAKSPKMIVLGSTGIGKTAMMRMIQKKHDRCHSIELDELSLNYISNSDVVNFLIALDVPLDHFFQALWRHVICIEYIKLRFRVDSAVKSERFFARVRDRFRSSQPRQKALQYLEKWERKFWINFDESVREITVSLENQIEANFGAELEKYKADAGYARKTGLEKRSQLQKRLRKFVDADLLSELSQVINLLAEYDVDDNATNYVLIDRLDENWISNSTKIHLVRALVEALKGLRRIGDLKVVVSLRSDLMERVIVETKDLGFQGEKYEDYVLRLRWDADQLRRLINSRINLLYRRKYKSENIQFQQVFVDKIGKGSTFSFLVERTLHRPRDMISFVNNCLEHAAGKSEVRRSDVHSAERVYSEGRRVALVDEWRPIFPGVEPLLRLFERRRAYFPLSELHTADTINKLLLGFYEDERFQKDSLWGQLDRATAGTGSTELLEIVRTVVDRTYLMGVLGVNTEATKPVQWFYKTQQRLARGSIDLDTKLRIHPMLHSALGIVN